MVTKAELMSKYTAPPMLLYNDGEPIGYATYEPGEEQYGMQRLYDDVASGAVKIDPQNFDWLLSDADRAFSSTEFGLLPQHVQAAARANPQKFAQSALQWRNSANHDLGSLGAEGGYASFNGFDWNPDTGIKPDERAFMKVNDEGFLETYGPMIAGLAMAAFGVPGMIGGAFGLSGATGAAVGGGLMGGVTSKLAGGDFAKGALTGAVGGAVGSGVGGALKDAGISGLAAKAITGAATGGAKALVGGGNVGQGLLMGGLGGAAGYAGQGLTEAAGVDPNSFFGGLLKQAPGLALKLAMQPQPRQQARTLRTAGQGMQQGVQTAMAKAMPPGARKVGNIYGRA